MTRLLFRGMQKAVRQKRALVVTTGWNDTVTESLSVELAL
jgi:hypothetical protein